MAQATTVVLACTVNAWFTFCQTTIASPAIKAVAFTSGRIADATVRTRFARNVAGGPRPALPIVIILFQ